MKDEEIEIKLGGIVCPKCGVAYIGLDQFEKGFRCYNCMNIFTTGSEPDSK